MNIFQTAKKHKIKLHKFTKKIFAPLDAYFETSVQNVNGKSIN